MRNKTSIILSPCSLFVSMLTVVLLAGCTSAGKTGGSKQTASAAPGAPVATTPPSAPVKPAEVAPVNPVIRINAGTDATFTDSSGNVWLSDRGFDGGDVVTRADDMKIENTKDPALYRTEHYSMNSFSQPLPNGKYVVKLHFAETWLGVEGPGGRVFSFNVEGHEFKDFDVWVKAGGPRRAYIETVNVDIADGKLDITFKSGIDNPEINGIEIHPAP
jgi:hypothetical protein